MEKLIEGLKSFEKENQKLKRWSASKKDQFHKFKCKSLQ